MLRATEKITALYCRLSVEDTKDEKKNGKEDPSNSIQHQQVMLMQYAKANRLPNPTYFIDDGYSGVTYGVHRLYGQFQNLHKLHLGQEAEGQSDGESQDFLQHSSGDYFFGSL